MGNIKYDKTDRIKAINVLNELFKLFKNKEMRESHVEIYDFIVFYAPLFLEKKDAVERLNQFQALFEKEGKSIN